MRIDVKEACQRLRSGEVVAVPTETVYGLAAPVANPESIERIFALKKRPADNPLIIHLAEAQDLNLYTLGLPPEGDCLIDAYWPGPLTLVLPIDIGAVPAIARAHLRTAAFRVPAQEAIRAVMRSVGALVAPSANQSGRPSATRPEHVEEHFGHAFPVLDAGPCPMGLESTILLYQDAHWCIGRLGALSAEELESVLGYQPQLLGASHTQPVCPGSHFGHYAPKAQLILGHSPYTGTPPVVVGFADRSYLGAQTLYALGSSTDPIAVAHNLYEILHQLDRHSVEKAWVDMHFPMYGLWKTISERLTRAAAQT